MKKNVQIQKIKQVIRQRRDNDLQTLYRQAAGAGVSPITILRLWHGQVDLSGQPEEVLDFLVRALDINDGCPAGESQDNWGEIRTARDDLIDRMRVGDPWLLRAIIEKNAGADEIQIAPVLAVLAWMGFEQEEALDIRLEEVDILGRTIRTREIPDELYPVIAKYFFDWVCMTESRIGRDLCGRRTGGGHYLIKADHGGRASGAMLTSAMDQFGLSYQDIRMAGEHQQLRRIGVGR